MPRCYWFLYLHNNILPFPYVSCSIYFVLTNMSYRWNATFLFFRHNKNISSTNILSNVRNIFYNLMSAYWKSKTTKLHVSYIKLCNQIIKSVLYFILGLPGDFTHFVVYDMFKPGMHSFVIGTCAKLCSQPNFSISFILLRLTIITKNYIFTYIS